MMLRIGNCTIRRVVEQEFEPTFGFLFPAMPVDALGPDREWLEPDHVDLLRGVVRLAIQSFIVKVDNLTILVDTGIGENKNRHRAEWHLRRNTCFLHELQKCGAAPEDIDLVICTHIHVDHVGWNTVLEGEAWRPTFPNARYLFPAAELDHMQALAEKPAFYTDSVAPLAAHMVDRVALNEDICPGVSLVPLPGHSPGMVGLRIGQGEQCAILCSDALHSPFQVRHPHVSSALCSDPDLARRTRLSLLENCANESTLLVPAHLRGYAAMRIIADGSGFRPVFVSDDEGPDDEGQA